MMHKYLQSRQNNATQVWADSESTRRFERRNDDTPATDDERHYLRPPIMDMPKPPPIKFAHLPLGITITRKELDIIKLTAQFVAVYGKYFRRELTMRVFENPLFEFMKPTDSRNRFYTGLILGYSSVLMPSQKLKTKSDSTREVFDAFSQLLAQVPEKEEDGVEIALTDLHAYEYFANMFLSRSPLVKFPFFPKGITITRKEVDIIKLTAQFVAVYGKYFRVELMKKVLMNPQFEFVKSTDSKHSFYMRLVDGFLRVFKRSIKNGAGLGEVLDGFFKLLDQALEKQEGVEMAMTDLHAFEFFANVEDDVLQPLPEQYLPMMMMPPLPPLILRPLGFQFTHLQGPSHMMKPTPPRPQNDLQSGQSNSNKAPASVATIEPPPEIRNFIQKTALFVSKNGLETARRFMELSMNDTRYRFVWSTHPYHAFYQLKLAEYCAQNQDRAQDIQPNVLRSFGVGFEFPEKEITLKELGIIKLTAQFMARYGINFVRDLKKIVVENPKFEFLESTSSRFSFYNRLVIAYSRVLMPSKILSKSDDFTATVLDVFFHCLQLEKQEEGVDMAMIDLLDYFASLEDEDYSANVLQPQHLSTQMQPGMLVYPLLGSKFPHLQASQPPPMPETSPPPPPLPLKNESALVPEDQFLADPQHLDSSTIDDEWQVIDFTEQSLPENVSSLKEKIAGEIQIPANK